MSLKPGKEIGEEVHDTIDQFFRFEEGGKRVTIDGVENKVKDGFTVIVASRARHNVINTYKQKTLSFTPYIHPWNIRSTLLGYQRRCAKRTRRLRQEANRVNRPVWLGFYFKNISILALRTSLRSTEK